MQEYTLKKSLGQHFLKDENICKKIVDALQSHSFKQLLEVGPGAGALTKYLLDIKDIDFKAVELDEEKVIFLEKQFPAIKERIIHKSVLDIDAPFEKDFTVIGNFPYNISSQILFKILDWKERVPLSIGMFQKEVAQRIAAKSGSKAYGILSVLIQEFYDVTYLFDVPPESFNPPPKVMSGVIQLIKKENTFALQSERKFFVLVKTAFNQRRKMLRNAVKSLFDESLLQDEIFNKRAEQLTVEDFAKLTFKMI
ncbi:MAG TPA: 16S rRNA (adenine(1518)-N(6)/adenine(1519)-N(6))-dimethyltransferase RsmA [Arachidicoccus soli]|uniref:Ribosomal RNA small subunit methyltransferase A n=1 Tax=Arachidicoccus soli TaxID=2341117 RepID=A0A386HT97_9BACT|nr:16S rRNA (adenine(1518)-N(6)/adenine(1519)-N(6))-dimethyltransferase RsmA [Arachidicoccus soli]AYD49105.1 ribosomal RNA small subunit methyltransferase A [Arachidicoccus soli]HEU0227555.1 16S rRNA (adenine(1518)-N(6)/adenine(1519)-N(6))-dimethyltransferase RsmA [Arachidicoccus soli]